MSYLSFWWGIVEFAVIEVVDIFLHDVFAVKLGQDGEQRAPVPVVCHTAAIVTLPSQVAQSNKLHFL